MEPLKNRISSGTHSLVDRWRFHRLSLEEKSGGALSLTASIKEFQDAVNDSNLIDLRISGAKLTWSKRRSALAHIAFFFDIFLVSTEWNLMFRSSEEPYHRYAQTTNSLFWTLPAPLDRSCHPFASKRCEWIIHRWKQLLMTP